MLIVAIDAVLATLSLVMLSMALYYGIRKVLERLGKEGLGNGSGGTRIHS